MPLSGTFFLIVYHRYMREKTETGAVKRSMLAMILLAFATAAGATSFPEVPFCPFGGPTGWMNRITGYDGYRGYGDSYRYPPPVYYPSPYSLPDWRQRFQPYTGCDPNRRTCFLH